MDQRPCPISHVTSDTNAQGDHGQLTPSNMDMDIDDSNSNGSPSTGQDIVAHTLDSLLGVGVVDQDVLERDIIAKANRAMDAKEGEIDKKRLEKTRKAANKLQLEIRKLENNRKKLKRGSVALNNLEDKIAGLTEDLAQLETDEQDILDRIRARKTGQPVSGKSRRSAGTTSQFPGASVSKSNVGQHEGESHRDFLIRTGKITPFASISGLEKSSTGSSASLSAPSSSGFKLVGNTTDSSPMSHVKLRRPSWSLIDKDARTKEKTPQRSQHQQQQGYVLPERTSKRKALSRISKVKVEENDDKSLVSSYIKDEDMIHSSLVHSEYEDKVDIKLEDEHQIRIKSEDDENVKIELKEEYEFKIKPEDEEKVKIKLEEEYELNVKSEDEEKLDIKHEEDYELDIKSEDGEKVDIKFEDLDDFKSEIKDENIDMEHLADSDDDYKSELKDEEVDIKHLTNSDDEFKPTFKDEESDEADASLSNDEYKPELKDEDSLGALDVSDDDDYQIDADYDDLELERKPKRERSEKGDGGAAYKFLCEDDGDELHYQTRLSEWARKRRHLRWRVHHPTSSMETDMEESWDDPEQKLDPSIEMTMPHPTLPDAELEGRYRIPGDIYSNLGSGMHNRSGQVKEENDSEGISEFLDDDSLSDGRGGNKSSKKRKTKGKAKAKNRGRTAGRAGQRTGLYDDDDNSESPEKTAVSELIDRISSNGHILVTTYAGLRIHAPQLLRKAWSYIVLDEGHKIRNPDAAITLTCKQFRTPHRIILSGTPIQNNLNELWSLFDFVFPGRLGTLPVFQSQFAIPINLGGYANASNIQVQTAYKCAVVLRDLINPYLLRRMKADVASDMPKKSEQVLFCKLTAPQRKAYEDFLKSDALTSIMERKRHALYGIDLVRKICNHADILTRDPRMNKRKTGSSSNGGSRIIDTNAEDEDDYGDYRKSGKMVVVKALLELWKKENHRVLLFSQTRTMLDILEKFIRKEGYEYRRMDGTTPIQNRMGLVDEFNARDDIYVFLLTTKVGGLGVNLTGANRVIIFDPDWNPSTDVQARERAWRLGQTKEVTIYRLMTSGTIEEKIYHRQIFKQFLTNKILKDPKQKRFFKSHDMADLFKLEAEDAVGTETGGIFRGSELVVKENASSRSKGSSSDRSIGRSGGRSRSSRRGGDNIEDIERMDGVRKVERFQSSADQSREGMDGTLPGGVYGSGREGRTDEDEDQGLSFRPSGEASSSRTGSKDKQPEGAETDVLKSLFEMSGVHSALRHDEIMDSAKQEHLIVEREATRVAERAMAALKESRKRRRRQDLDIPTWTGKSGLAGAPRAFVEQQQQGKKPRFGTTNTFNSSVSARLAGEHGKSGGFGTAAGIGGTGSASASSTSGSSSLLAGMLERKRLEQGGGIGRNAGSATATSSQSSSPRIESLSITSDNDRGAPVLREGTREHLITRIRDFMLDHGGRVQSSDLVGHFQDSLSDEEQVVFKKMLRGIASLEKDEHSGQGWWKLKADYY
ncbi:hypothetical protein BGW38_000769 [Lunasporangiospora selenospora]|uniref:DNA excision repair protein ERCC-6 n=1 Tax=Lunasporangiospora selenospora TaxID=979761 RepID=A0A9P6FUD7_9FUNG|nr:hypothetical protein BGW38_000769 [Lunasporangiospora selenospora]